MLAVEGFDLVGDGEVLLGDGAVGDFGVAQGHVQAAVSQQRGDGFEGHAAVDGLGGQGVPQLVGMDVGQPGGAAGAVDQPGDAVPVERAAALVGQQQRVVGVDVGGAVVIDEGDQVRVQRQVAVLVELADGDVQPGAAPIWTIASAGSAVYSLTRRPVRKQHFDDDADQHAGFGLGGAEQLRRGRVVEGFGQRVVDAGQVAGEDRDPGGCFGPVPVLIRTKNIRSVPSRWTMVGEPIRGAVAGPAVSQGWKSSMWRRVIWAIEPTSGAHSSRNAANDRRAWSAARTLPGRSMQASWSR